MFTRVFDRGPAKRKLIAWGLGFVALAGMATLSASESFAVDPCVASKTVWSKGSQFDSFTGAGTCTWTVPSGITTVDADVVGGGGGGAVSQHTGGGGGGGGQVVRLRSFGVTAGTVETVTVGAGAPQVFVTDAVAGAVGGTGGSSSFLNYTAAGGLGGKPSTSSTLGGNGGASYTESTITARSGTVSTVLKAGAVAVAGNSTCTVARNGGGGASSFAAGLQTGGTALTSSAGANAIATNTLFGYEYSGGGGGHRDPVGSASITPAPGGAGGGGDGGVGTLTVGGTPTYATHGTNGTGGGGGGIGGTCGKHSFGVGAGTTRGGSGAVVVKFLSPSPMTAVTASGWQGYTQLDWPDYADTATTGYKVYWATTSAALNDSAISTLPAANIFTVTGATASQYLHKNLAINSTFYYRVAATYTNAAAGISTSPLSVLTSATTQLTDSKTFIQTGPNDSQQTTFAAKDLVVPANVSLIQFDANGASANSLGITGAWGTGGSVSAVVPVTAGETLKLYVGSQPITVNGTNIAGWNGGGTSGYGIGGFGGGASDVRRGGTALANRILVAGGAAGRGYNSYGGFGGGLIASSDSGAVVAGGTQTGPGAAPSNIAQTNGALGVGASSAQIYSGAGGGGYWGGNANVAQYGSGGGSSYTDPSANSVVHTKGGVTGDGSITATYSAQTLVPTGVKVVPGQAQNTIAWDRISLTGANGYKVYGGTTPNPTTLVGTVTGVNTLAYVHTGLTNGSTYYYRVAATTAATSNNTNLLTTGYSLEVAATPTFLATVNFETIRATQNWTVPQGVTWIQVTAKGASANALGITGSWGTGGTVSAILPVTPGEVLNINVGSQPNTINGVDTVGWNGGGTSGYGIAGYGGGASDIRRGGTALANRVLVAGGAGGRGYNSWGGPGGSLVGGTESAAVVSGGTQTGPGVAPSTIAQTFGTLGVGASTAQIYSGAGGGGYWGGNANVAQYAAGGGSSYTHPDALNVIHTKGGVTGDGSISISYPTVAYPIGVKAIAGQGFNTIVWDESLIAGATGYKVYGGTTPNPTTLLTTTAVAFGTNTYTHKGIAIGTTYYYRVTVMSGTLESQKSAEVSAIPAFSIDKQFKVTRGVQTFTVPSGVYWLRAKATGASANASGITGTWGTGGMVTGLVPVTPGEVLSIYVGAQPNVINGVDTVGWNGGGTSGYGIAGYGGGASDIRRGGTALSDRIFVAGGAAGRGYNSWGGPGGGLIGTSDSAAVVAGGTQTRAGWQPANIAQTFGTFGVGASTAQVYSGAGGGGYWGGNANVAQYAGGGGSSFTDATIVDVVHTKGGNIGDGSITLSYSLNQAPQNFAAVPNNNKVSLSWNPSEISNLVDYQIFKGTTPNPTTLLTTVLAGTNVYVDTAVVNGTSYYYRMVARATVNAVSTASQSTADVVSTPSASTTVSFTATGAAQTWQVPARVSWVQVVAKGAAGGAITGNWGTGGVVSASLPVTPGETLNLFVGTQPKLVAGVNKWGWNGGGTSGYGIPGGGGGATDIRRAGTALANRVLVAGGGGGRGYNSWGGPGGTLTGGTESAAVVAGGTQTGPGWQPSNITQTFGALGVGASSAQIYSGGGGGGYWGGNANVAQYAAGGGSSYTEPFARNVIHTSGTNTADGSLTITYVLDTTAPTVSSITSPAINTKQYKAGEDIYVDVNFNETVVVTGSPTLDINAGLGGQRTISYVSGSGTASLRFLYTVLPGDDKTNLDVFSTTALSIANGSTIDDAAGNTGVLTLPALGSANSLASRALVVDGIVPLPPVMVSAGGGTQIAIDWTDVTDADLAKYNVYVSTDGTTFNQLNSVISTQASPLSQFTQQVVARGITYYYYVTAVDVHGNESAPSIVASWSIAADGTIQTPSITAKALTNNLRQPISGKAVPGATVELKDAGVVIGSVTADATTGEYSFTPTVDWSVGNHDITAKATLNAVESTPTVISKMMVDTVAPTFTSQMRLNPSGEKTASVVLVWKLTFSEPMTSLDTTDFAVTGTTAAVASVTQSFGTTNAYDVRITGGDIGIVNGNISLAFRAGQTATDIAGNPLSSTTATGTVQQYVLDHSYPVVTLATDKAVLGSGQTATISITTSLDPNVGELTTEDLSAIGGTISNFAGSGSSFTATFTPQAGYQGEATIDMIYGAFNSSSGLPNLRATQLTMVVDMVAPTVTGVTATPSAGAFKSGDVIDIAVKFSERVNVTGTPTLKLETGTTDQVVNYATGDSTDTLVFRYTVQSGNTATDLNYFDINSLVATGGNSIKDAGLNAATLTLPAVTAATVGNLATNAAIVIDTTAPATVSALIAFTPVGGTVVAETLNSTNTNLTATFSYAGDAAGGKAELVFNNVVVATLTNLPAVATNPMTFNVGATSTATLQAVFTTQMTGTMQVRLTDAAGNVSTGNLPVQKTVDFTKPTISAFTGLASVVSSAQTITITTSESTTNLVAADIVSSCGGTGTLAGSGSSYTYTWTPAANTTGSCTFTVAAGNFSDSAGNLSSIFTASTTIDNVAPTVTGVTAVSPNATYIVGQTIDLAVNFSEPVVVVGTPTLAIKSAATTSELAQYVSGTATNKLVFRYTIALGDNSADLNYLSTTALAISAGITIKDAAGNNATLTLPAVTVGTAGNLATNAAIVVDALAPSAPGAPTITVVGGTVVSTFINATNINITATIAGLTAGDVTGGKAELLFTPNGGTATVVAADTAISATDTTASFDLGATSAGALQAMIVRAGNGTGTFAVRLTDVSGNVSTLGTATSAFTVDYVKPTMTIVSSGSGQLVAPTTLTMTASETTVNFAVGDIAATGGTLSTFTVDSTDYKVTFTPTVQGAWSATVAAGNFTDAAGNPSVAAVISGTADTVASTITSITSLTANGNFKAGDVIDIALTFNEGAFVTGTPSLLLETGATDRSATYVSGSGTATLTFRYTVQPGDVSADLNINATSALTGTIKDAAGNTFVNAGVNALSGASTLAGSAALVVNAVAPTAPSALAFTAVGGTVRAGYLNTTNTNLTASVTIAANTIVGGKAELFLGTNPIATISSITSTTATSLSFDIGSTTNATLQSAIGASGNLTVKITDAFGNSSLTASPVALVADYVKPQATITSGASSILNGTQTATITFNTSEDSTDFATGDATANLGSLGAISGSGSNYTATFTPNASGVWSVAIAAGTYTDLAGNPNNISTPATGTADVLAPTAIKVTGVDKLYKSGDAIDITVEFSEAVNVDANRILKLAIGSGVNATYLSGNGSTKLVFRYTVQAGDQAIDLNYLSSGAWAGTGNLTDLAGNIAGSFALPGSGTSNALAGTSNINIDASAPVAPNAPTFTITTASAGTAVANTLNRASTNLVISSSWSTADPTLAQAEFLLNGSVIGTTAITNAASQTSVSFDLGTATEAALQAAVPAGGAVTVRLIDIAGNTVSSTSSSLSVDFTAASLLIAMPIGMIIGGQTRTITFNLSEAATSGSFTVVDITATNGTLSNFAGSGSLFTATFTPSANFTGSTSIGVAGATFTDLAGNANDAATSITSNIDTQAPTVTLDRSAATSTVNDVTYTVTGNEPIDCTTLSTSTGLDFDLTAGALVSIAQTSSTVCTITVKANATRGSPATPTISKAATFSVSDASGNATTALSVTSGAITVTLPTFAPTAPLNLAGTAAPATASLTFTAPTDDGGSAITSYVIESSTTSATANDFAVVSTGITISGTSATVTGLTNGTNYWFRVKAVNAVGASPYSAVSAAIKPIAAPDAPTALSIDAGDSQLTVTITAGGNGGSNITAYQYSLDGGISYTAFSTTSLTQTITGLVNGNPYTLMVRALNAAGTGSAFTASAAATPVGRASAPTITAVSALNGSLRVSFTAPVSTGGSGITNYKYSLDGGATFTALATPATTSPITITGLTNGTSYSVKILAVTSPAAGALDGLASNAVSGTPVTTPDAPTNLSVVGSDGKLTASFTAGDNGGATQTFTATATQVDAQGVAVSGGEVVTATGSSSPIEITGLTSGRNYRVTVFATNQVGSSAVVDSGATPIVPSGLPATPMINHITAGSGGTDLDIAFSATTGGSPITAYEYAYRVNVENTCSAYNANSATPYSAWASFSGAGGHLNIAGLTNGWCYDVKIRVANLNGYSAESRASGMPVTNPGAPTITKLTRGNGKVTVTFTSPADNGGLPIVDFEYSIDNGTTWVSGGLYSPFAITGLTNGSQYGVILRTKTDEGIVNSVQTYRYSVVSNSMTQTPATVPGQTVIVGNPVAGDGFVDLDISSLTANGGSAITSYQYSTDGGTNWALADWAGGTTVRVSGLTNSTSTGYQFNLRAVNVIGAGAASTQTASVSAGLVPAAPTVSAVASDSSIALTYSTNADGGFAITRTEYSIDNGATWVTLTATPTVITGLTNGTTYSVQVRSVNAKGNSAAATATATPAGAASAPTITGIVSGSQTATVTITAPTNTGGSGVVISGYEVSINGGLTWATATMPTATTISLTGLTNGATYPVKVRALNNFGAGAASNSANALPVANVPGAPSITAVAGRSIITVSVTAPGSDGGAPISAYVYSISGSNWIDSGWTPSSQNSTFIIYGLVNGTSYDVSVRAVNSAGQSLSSNQLTGLTPSGLADSLNAISGYSGTGTAPTATDYTDAGVTSVDATELAGLNSILAALSPSTLRDSTAEIQAIVDAFNKLMALANGTDDYLTADLATDTHYLTVAEWALLGQTFTSAQAALANDLADQSFFSNLNSATELQAYTAAVIKVMALSGSITLADAQALGLATITSANVANFATLIAAQGANTAVDTRAELLTLAATADAAAKAGVSLAAISAYTGTGTAPTAVDYATAGVTGVDGANLAAINELVGPASSAATDSAAELQAITDAINKLRAAANGSSSTPGSLTATDLAALGLTSVDTAAEIALFNQIIAGDGFGAVDTAAERATFVALIDKLMALAASTPPNLPNPTLTEAELASLGITGVTAANLQSVLTALAATAADGSGVDSLAELQSIANAAAAAQAAFDAIAGYNGTQNAPTAAEYNAAGLTGVDSSNLAAINSYLASLPVGSHDTLAEMQAIMDAVNHLLAQANGIADNGSFVTVTDLNAIGITTSGATAASQAALLNSAIDASASTAIDTLAETQALMTVIAKIALQAAGIAQSLDATDFAAIGVSGVDSTNIAGLLSRIAATADNGSGVDSIAEIQALLAAASASAAQDAALAKITAYNSSSTGAAVPTVADYVTAGIIGVGSQNINAVNSLVDFVNDAIAARNQSGVVTPADIQAIVDAYNKLQALADSTVNSGTGLTAAEFAAIGVGSIDSTDEVALANNLLDGMAVTAVDSSAELSAFAAAVTGILGTVAVDSSANPVVPYSPALTVADFEKLGITGVTSANLANVIAALQAATSASSVDSKLELQALINAAALQAIQDQSAALIAQYGEAGATTVPTVADYLAAGVIGVDANNLAAVNAFVESLGVTATDTRAELQAIADAVAKLGNAADGAANGTANLTATDIAALGGAAATTSAAEIALFNSIVDGLAAADVDTQAEIANIARIVDALATIAAGGTASPALTPADFALVGITGVTTSPNGGNMAAMLNQIAATADNGSGIDSLGELNTLVSAANAVAVRDNALAQIIAYTGASGQTAPTSTVYAEAQVSGVSGLNVAAIDSLIASLPATAKDSSAEIQAVVDAYAKVYALADSSAGSAVTGALTAAEFAVLGLGIIDTAAELAIMNGFLDTAASAATDSAAELAAMAEAAAKLAATAAIVPPAALPNPGLTVADLQALGMNGVTADNLAAIIAAIAASADNGTGADTKAELQALVDAGAAQAIKDAAAAAISLYTGAAGETAPTRNNYSDAGVTGVDLTNRDLINSIVAELTPAASDSTAELQAVVDAANKVKALADGTAANGLVALNATDAAAIGLPGLNSTGELALFNTLLDAAQIGAVDSFVELAEIARIVEAIMSIAAGGNANPALTAADFELIGITGLDADSVDDMVRLMATTADSGSGVDTIGELQAISVAAQAAAATAAALDLISNYDGTNQAAVTATFAAAGVTGVTVNNLAAVNSYIAGLSLAATDTTAEVQAAVDAATKLFGLADQITTSGSALANVSLNSTDLAALGVQDLGSNANKLALLNSILDTLPFTDVDTVGELANLVDIVNRLIKAAMGELVVPALSPADFAALGITGVTDSPNGGNLSVIVAALGGAGSDGSGINSITKLTSVVGAAVTDFNTNPTIKAIVDYANSNLNPLPTVIDYNSAGINLVDAETLDAVNKIVDAKIGADVSSAAKVYQIVYDLFVALGKIVAYVADTSANTAPALQDYQAAGLVDIDAATAARLTAAIAGLTAGDVDSSTKLAALLRELRRPVVQPTPTPGPDPVTPPPVVIPVDPVDPGPVTPPTPEPVTKVEVKPIAGSGTGLNLSWAGSSAVAVKVVASTGVAQEFTATGGEVAISDLTPGRAYAIQLSPVGSTDPNLVQTVNYVVRAATPIDTQVTQLSPNRVHVTWNQVGFAKLYKVTLTQGTATPISYVTGDRMIDLGVLAGLKFAVSVVAVGEGDTVSPATMINLNLNTAVASVIATPFAAKKETLITWKTTVVNPSTKYIVRIDGKIVCTGTATTCIVKKVLTSKNLVTVAVVGGAKTAVAIDDKKLVLEGRVTFAPNSVTLSSAALAIIKDTAADLKKAKFTKVVVTGHANPVDGVPISVSEKIANQRALAIVTALRKLLPGVQIVAVGRSVFAPANAKADSSISNMRAEIYGSK